MINRQFFCIARKLSVFLALLLLCGCAGADNQPPSSPRPDISVTETSSENDDNLAGVNGADSSLNPPAPFYNSYNVTLEINPLQRKLLATEKISYKNQTGKELEKIYLRFNITAFAKDYTPKPYYDEFEDKVFKYGEDYSEFLLNSLTINSERVEYEINGRNIGVILKKPLPPDSNIDITMQFECTIPEIAHRIGANGDAMWFGNFIPVVATYYNGDFVINQYYPAGEPFIYEVSNFDVTVTTPGDYHVYGTGIAKMTENETNRVTKFSINMVRDFAFVLSKSYKTESRTSDSGVTINFHHYTDNPQKASMVLDTAVLAANYFSERLGQFPFQEIDIAETELPFFGANAFPCIVFLDSEYFSSAGSFDAVSLEIGRQWIYNVVGSNQIDEAWLGVGLASYLQTRMNFRAEMINIKMKALYAELSKRLIEASHYSLLDDLSVYESWQEYTDVHVSRAALMFHALQLKLGQEKWNELIKLYYSENSFKTATGKGFIELSSRVYGENLDDFFESWFSWRNLPNLP